MSTGTLYIGHASYRALMVVEAFGSVIVPRVNWVDVVAIVHVVSERESVEKEERDKDEN